MAYNDITDDCQLAIEVDAALKRLRIASVSADDFLLRSTVEDLRRASGVPETVPVTVQPLRRFRKKVDAPDMGRPLPR